MRRTKLLWTLAALNACLLVALSWKMAGENVAHAQAGGPSRGDLLMVPAKVTGANNGVVYMVDSRNAMLTAFFYDSNQKALNTMPPIDLNRVFNQGAGAGNPNRKPGGR